MKMLYLLIAVLLSPFVQASCKMPAGEKIIIGCTYQCDFATRFRLRGAATRLGYKLKFINISNNKDITESLSGLDSVLIPGGADIHPKYYLKNVTPELREYTENNLSLVKFSEEGKRRDIFEYTLLKVI